MEDMVRRSVYCAGPYPFLLYRKFPKSSEIVYNELEIKNLMKKERRCYFAMTLFVKFFVSVQLGTALSDGGEIKL